MKILIIGGGGMVGQKLAWSLSKHPVSADDEVTLFDMVFPEASAPGTQITGNVTDAGAFKTLAAKRFDLVFIWSPLSRAKRKAISSLAGTSI